MDEMKAVRCHAWGEAESLTVETLPVPQPGAGEVLLRVRAAGVNFPDTLIIQGKYQFRPELPFTPGSEVAGEVLATGEGVSHVQVGDRVIAFLNTGGYATHALADARQVMPMPPELGFAEAAAFTLASGTSYHALVDRAGLRAGETLLVLGAAGGVGLSAVQIGHALGARVIAAASSDDKLALCREHGADDTINYASEDLRARLKELTGGRGPDVIYDPVGGSFAEPAFRSVAWGGRYLVVGFAAGDIPALPLNLPLLKGASVVGVFWGEFARRDPRGNARNLATMIGWMKEGRMRLLVSGEYPLEGAAQALRDLEGRRVTGKVVIVPE
ncbi:NADPH:quinone oxidoreductase [Deinococcus aquiradiocola]|uniref:NADPH:quinone oxidoreductase n=2 Tax=Deinococcus aquiradiocola TaxID=393059 RepID=A0A917PS95_9DEIO|nr:NADPH:quinone oxidoreductase [Deinococcus aquiradiocola]